MNMLRTIAAIAVGAALQGGAPALASAHGAGCFCTWYGDFDGDGVADRSFTEFAANCAAASGEVWTVVNQGSWAEFTTDLVCANNNGFIGNATSPASGPTPGDNGRVGVWP